MVRSAQVTAFAGLLSVACLASRAAMAASTVPIPLSPPGSHLRYTVYALGAVPMQASFRQFSGALDVNPRVPGFCAVQVTVQIASLHMADPISRRLALGEGLLDAGHYPVMHFGGQCRGKSLAGLLTLHGVTRPITMAVRHAGTHVVAEGSILRREFGIRGLPGLIGQLVRFQIDADLPEPEAADGT